MYHRSRVAYLSRAARCGMLRRNRQRAGRHRRPPLQLSKSRFLAGLQCLKRLYLACHHRELADPVEAGRQAVFDTGAAVGKLARRRFPDGILVEEQYFEHSQAVRSTQALLSDASVPALFEPAFTFRGIRARVDVLSRSGGRGFDLVEVKSTTRARDEHIRDVAIQMYVVEGSGVPVGRAYLMHIDNTYVYQGGDHDPDRLFSLRDVTDEARAYAADEMPGALARMWESLQLAETLDIDTGRHCTTPYRCPFFGHCHRDEPEHPVRDLPGLTQGGYERLEASGIRDIGGIPPDFTGLSLVQRRVRDSVVAGRPFVGPDLASRLGEIGFPAGFLDFEALNPAIPIYVGTRPYQTIPFQWSLHVRDSDGGLRHSAFLDDGPGDPRERLVAALLAAIPSEGAVVAYSGYEETVMKGLAQAFPQYGSRLLAVCERVVDLLQLVRGSYYHPGFHGSFSIKSVLPALVPGLAYDDLEIPEGMAAAAAYARLIAGDTPQSDEVEIREALLAYCERDTEAMVRVYEALLAESGAWAGLTQGLSRSDSCPPGRLSRPAPDSTMRPTHHTERSA